MREREREKESACLCSVISQTMLRLLSIIGDKAKESLFLSSAE
jgi:hypothetical protein